MLEKRMPAKPKMEAAPWRKSSPEMVAKLDVLLKQIPEAERRVMFGFPCAFLHGNMFTGLYQEQMFFRLAATDKAEFLKLPGATPFEPVKGRVMREYVTVPQSMLEDEVQLKTWLARSLMYALSLPVKVKKAR
jgi:TfoX/Sxy family transcriptional regulator of competence genes